MSFLFWNRDGLLAMISIILAAIVSMRAFVSLRFCGVGFIARTCRSQPNKASERRWQGYKLGVAAIGNRMVAALDDGTRALRSPSSSSANKSVC